jgi:hypothetical protein
LKCRSRADDRLSKKEFALKAGGKQTKNSIAYAKPGLMKTS